MAVALSVVAYPLLRPESGRALRFAAPAGPLEDLLSRRDAAYAGIKELEFEHELGNLSREDFQALRDEYRFKAARLLQEIESAAQARDHDAAAAGMKRVAFRGGVECADRGTRFHRRRGHALNPGLNAGHMRGASERRLGRCGIADICVDADIGVPILPYARCVAARGRRGNGYRGKRLIVDDHPLGGVPGRVNRFGDHHRDGLAHESGLVRRQQAVRHEGDLGAVAVAQADVGRAGQNRTVRNRLQAVCQHIGAGEHGQHAWNPHRFGSVDCSDARVGVRRAHHGGVDLSLQVDVVAETAPAGQQAQILLANDGCSDARVQWHSSKSKDIAYLDALAPCPSASLTRKRTSLKIGRTN